MKKLPFLVLAFGSAAAAQAPQPEWQAFFNGTDGSRAEYDVRSLARTGSRLTARVRGSDIPTRGATMEVRLLIEVECSDHTARVLEIEAARGSERETGSPDTAFSTPPAASPARALIEALCQTRG